MKKGGHKYTSPYIIQASKNNRNILEGKKPIRFAQTAHMHEEPLQLRCEKISHH